MIIVDACVAAKLFIAEPDSEQAERVLTRGDVLIAPDLILLEVTNALQKAWRRQVINAEQMDRAVSTLPTLFGRLYPTPDLIADAAVLSRIFRHPVPDCVYAALHWRTGAPVVTADEAFVKATLAVPAWSNTAIRLKDFDPA
jgi:predicted nucleic acid-binding protein